MKTASIFMPALSIGAIAILASMTLNNCLYAADPPRTVRDLAWVWGNPEMAKAGTHTVATFAGAGCAERARLLGVPNVVMAGSGLPNDGAKADALTNEVASFQRLVWETTPDGTGLGPPFVYKDRMAQIRKLVDKYPQIEGVLLDDMSTGKMDRGFKPEHIRHIREQFPGKYQAVKVWGVVYSMSLDRKLMDECLKELDVINLWVWHAKDIVDIDKYVAHCERVAPGKPIYLGIYLYDYGGERRMPLDLLKQHCEAALKLAHAGRIAGMVFLTINDDPQAVGWAADWIKRVGDQKLGAAAANPTKEPVRFTTTIPTIAGGSPWPTWIEGPDDTILMVYGAAGDSKVHVASSSDAGLNWEEITTLDYQSGYNYFTRLADGSLIMVVTGGGGSTGWIRSLDHGRNWSEFHPISTDAPSGFPGVFPYGPIIEMSDGRWAYCPYLHNGEDGHALVTWSQDRGKTWDKPIRFSRPADGNQGLTEVNIVQLAPNSYLAAIRADDVKRGFDGFYLSRSEDGWNWSVPAPLGDIGRMPLFYRIGDHWVLAYRQYAPSEGTAYGVLRLSRDGLRWSKPHRIEKGVNNAPFLVQVKGKLIALNHQFPTRQVLMRQVVDITELARPVN